MDGGAESDGAGEFLVFCPECWQQEFGAENQEGPLGGGPSVASLVLPSAPTTLETPGHGSQFSEFSISTQESDPGPPSPKSVPARPSRLSSP